MNSKVKQDPSLKSQSAWLLFAKIVGFGFAFILPIIIVRILDKDDYGLYRQSFLVVMNAVAILPVGMAMSAYYYLAREKAKRAPAVFNILAVHFGVGLIGFLILFFFPDILGAIFKSPEMTRLAPLVGAAIWLWLFSVFLETVAVANREARVATAFIVFAQFSKTLLMCGFVLYFRTVESILYAAIVQAAFQSVILLVFLASRFPGYWKQFDPAFLREHIKYAVPFGIAGILWTMQVDLHYYFVGYRYGESQLAVYAVGCFQLPLVAMLAESVNSVMIPRMSELQLENDKREMIRVTARAMQKLAFAYFPIYVFLFITSHTLITTLFTAKYEGSVAIFVIFLTLLPFHILVADPIVRAYESLGRFLLKLRIFTFIILVSALYLGINYLDLRGIIAIVVAVRVLEMLVVELVVLRSVGAKPSDIKLLRNVGITAILSIISGIGTIFVYEFAKSSVPGIFASVLVNNQSGVGAAFSEFVTGTAILAVSFVAFTVIYLTGAILTGTIEESEKDHVRSLLRKTFRRFKR